MGRRIVGPPKSQFLADFFGGGMAFYPPLQYVNMFESRCQETSTDRSLLFILKLAISDESDLVVSNSLETKNAKKPSL